MTICAPNLVTQTSSAIVQSSLHGRQRRSHLLDTPSHVDALIAINYRLAPMRTSNIKTTWLQLVTLIAPHALPGTVVPHIPSVSCRLLVYKQLTDQGFVVANVASHLEVKVKSVCSVSLIGILGCWFASPQIRRCTLQTEWSSRHEWNNYVFHVWTAIIPETNCPCRTLLMLWVDLVVLLFSTNPATVHVFFFFFFFFFFFLHFFAFTTQFNIKGTLCCV